MTMTRNDLLNAIIDDGIMEITTNYLRPDQKQKREGGIAGFEACRGKTDGELLILYQDKMKEREGFALDIRNSPTSAAAYTYLRWFELQVEWVLNVLSAAMRAHNREPLTNCTLKGHLKAVSILNGDSF